MRARIERLAKGCAAGVGALSVAVIAAWQLDLRALTNIHPDFVAMNPLTALLFGASAVSLHLLAPRERGRTRDLWGRGLGAAVALTGAAKVLILAGVDLAPDELLFASKLEGNRMAPNTGLGFLVFGLGALTLDWKWKDVFPSQVFGAALGVMSYLALLGYAYGATALYNVPRFIPMALHTALAFLACAFALLGLRAQTGVMALVTGAGGGSVAARRILPVVVAVPAVIGGLTAEVSVVVALITLILFAIAGWTASQVNALERELRRAKADLEVRFEERGAALRDTQAQVMQLQKMDALGRLAGGIAHDFNNMLAAVEMYCDLAADHLDPSHPAREQVEEIRKVGARAATLTRQLLVFSRRQMLPVRPIDLNDSIRQMEKMLRRLIPENVAIHTRLAPRIGRIRADEGQIEQIIMNLVLNARDAMPDGGELVIETSRTRLDEQFARTHLETAPGEYVLLSVSDTGVGMDLETRQKIFEPFFTTKPMGKGTGLGLTTVYGIVKQSSGSVWVYSEPGKGTVFRIYLPVIAEDRTDEAPEGHAAGESERGMTAEASVLLIEDDEQLRGLFARILEKCGCRVTVAADGRTALEIFEKRPGEFQLLVSDVMMPGMSGFELARRLREAQPGIRVLMLSGYAHEPGEDGTRSAEGFDPRDFEFLQKPFSSEALRTKVREILARTGAAQDA